MDKIDKKVWYTLLAIAVLAVISLAFFYPDNVQHHELQQNDILQGMANGQEAKAFHEQTGETTRWTNSLFGGMPTFQISPSYPSSGMLDWIAKVYTLGLPSPSNLLFAMFLGFFLMCLCMKTRWYTALFGAIAWGFSTYFIIIIGAGHIWKFLTLMYIPPTIGGIILCYRGKYLGGTAMAALFAALQLQSNHPQMSYYFVLLILIMVICWLVMAIKQYITAKKKAKETGIPDEKRVVKDVPSITLQSWCKATACVLVAGLLGLMANISSIYNTYEYSKETVRGKATEIPVKGQKVQEGADFDYITAWSYGIDETMTLLIPNVKGGASTKPVAGRSTRLSVYDTPTVQSMETGGQLAPEEAQLVAQFPQYFGDQPGTNGPVYVGVLVLLLAIVAMFAVKQPLKWALFAATVLSILLAWGYHFEPFSKFFVDHFPMYNKFRTVSSILVVAEFCIPVLAVMCVGQMLKNPGKFWDEHHKSLLITAGVLAFFCLAGALFPQIYGNPFSYSEMKLFEEAGILNEPAYANMLSAIRSARMELVSADAWRSLAFLVAGVAVLWFFLNRKPKMPHAGVCMVACLIVITVIDLYTVNKRYVNHDNFVQATEATAFEPNAADREILKDTTMNYRVWDQYTGGARASYFHKSLEGYHAAKLTRYQDFITHMLGDDKSRMSALNMMNCKYVIAEDQGQPVAIYNDGAQGNAWFVDGITYVSDAPAEMSTLKQIDVATKAVADKQFESVLGQAKPVAPGDTIFETSYAPNRLTYHSKSANGGLAVFSEVYFPWGWKATIDGKEVPVGRANYMLRAIQVPAGEHTIEMTFDPKSLHVTNTISVISIIVIYLLCLGAIGFSLSIVIKIGKQTRKSPSHKKC